MTDLQAVRRIGPFPASTPSTHPYYYNRAFRTPAAVDGSAQWTVPGTGFSASGNVLPGCWVTIKNISLTTTDLLRVSFQNLSLAAHSNVDSAADIVILPGEKEEFWLDPGTSSVKFGGPVTAIASHWRSST